MKKNTLPDQLIIFLLTTLLLFIPLIYFHDLRDSSSLPRYAFLGVTSGLFLILLSLSLYFKKNLSFSKGFLSILLLLLLAWLSLTWSLSPKNSLIHLLQLTSLIILSYTTIHISSNKLIYIPFIASIAGATIAASIGILQYFGFNPFNYHQFVLPASTFTNTNFASIYFDLIIPVSFIFIFIAKNNIQRFAASIASGLCLSFILISHTRGSWLGLAVALIVFIYILYKNEKVRALLSKNLSIKLPYLFLSFIISLSLFFVTPPDIQQPRKSSQLVMDASSKIRLNAYINSFSIIKDYPISGTGYGAFRSGFRNYMFSTVPFTAITEDNILLYLHNDPLQMFVELGMFGGILFIFIFMFTLRACWKISYTNKDPTIILITLGVFFALIASGVHSLVDFPLHKPTSAVQFWCWIGFILGISAKNIDLSTTYVKYRLILFISTLGIIFGIVFLSYNILFYKKYISASQHRLQAQKALITNDCQSAKIFADTMMNLFDYEFLHLSLYTAVYSSCPFSSRDKIEAMKRVLSQDPTNTRALITQGTIYLQKQNINEAKNNFLEVTRILPHKASGYIGLAYVTLSDHKYTHALELLNHALKLEPKNTAVINLIRRIKETMHNDKN